MQHSLQEYRYHWIAASDAGSEEDPMQGPVDREWPNRPSWGLAPTEQAGTC